MASSVRWEPITEWWEYKSARNIARRTTIYNPANNGVSVEVEYKERRGKATVECAGENLPDDIRLCRQVDSAPMVEMTPDRVMALRTVVNLLEIYSVGESLAAGEVLRAMLDEAKGEADETTE